MEPHEELNRTLGEILGEVKGVNTRLDRVNGRLDKHDDKINSLETFKDTATGKLAVVGTLAAFVFSALGVGINRMLWGN